MTIDSFDPKLEADLPSAKGGFEADIVCLTRKNPASSGLSGGPFVIDCPGEYEIKGVTVFGIKASAGNKEQKQEMTLYSLEIEDFYLAHLGSIGQKLTDEQVSELEGVDILMIPVGGVTSIGPKRAVEVIGQINPSIVIPMLYSDSAKLERFFDEMEIEPPEAVEKLKLKSRGDLPEETEVVLLNRSG